MLLTLLQDISIEEKVKNAPNSAYEIGVFIGSMLPFVILVVLAYFIYRFNKNKKQ